MIRRQIMKYRPTILAWLFASIFMVGLATTASAATISLVPSENAPDRGETFTLDIVIDDPTGVAGCAFTLNYPADRLIAPDPQAEGQVAGITSTFFLNFNSTRMHRENTSTSGKILFSGANINTSTGGAPWTLTNMILFTIPFTVKSDAPLGEFDFSLEQTQLLNADAGWGDGVNPESVPVLIGAVDNTHQDWSDLTKAFPAVPSTFVSPLTVTPGIDPCADTDLDELCDTVETNTGIYVGPQDTGTDPNNSDTDGDGLDDGDEINTHSTNPVNADSDTDTMPDGWEVMFGLNPNDLNDATGDGDSDGLTNKQEYDYGADPTDDDTDGDLIKDGDEVANGTDPAKIDNNAIALDMNSESAGIQTSRFVSAGAQVTVQIWAVNFTDLAGAHFVVNFDDTKLSYVSGGEPSSNSFMQSEGGSTLYPSTITTSNTVDISGAILSPDAANSPDGMGAIGEITFTVDSQLPLGTEMCLTFGTVEFSNPDLSKFIPFIMDDTTCLVIPQLLGDCTDSSVECGKPDGCVDFNDLLVFSACWGLSEGDASWCDMINVSENTGTQTIDFDDLIIFASNWGMCVGQ